MPSRWDFLYERKPVPIAEQLLEELAKLLAEDLERWPIALEEFGSEAEARRWRPLLEPGSPRPATAAYTEAFALARLELQREFEQIDDHMRNERWRERGIAPGRELECVLLLSRYLVEQMLTIAEVTQSRLKRRQLVDCLERAERRLALRSGLGS